MLFNFFSHSALIVAPILLTRFYCMVPRRRALFSLFLRANLMLAILIPVNYAWARTTCFCVTDRCPTARSLLDRGPIISWCLSWSVCCISYAWTCFSGSGCALCGIAWSRPDRSSRGSNRGNKSVSTHHLTVPQAVSLVPNVIELRRNVLWMNETGKQERAAQHWHAECRSFRHPCHHV